MQVYLQRFPPQRPLVPVVLWLYVLFHKVCGRLAFHFCRLRYAARVTPGTQRVQEPLQHVVREVLLQIQQIYQLWRAARPHQHPLQVSAAYVMIRQRGFCSIRQHTSAYVSIRATRPLQHPLQVSAAYVTIRQHMSAYVSIRQHTPLITPSRYLEGPRMNFCR